jgi:cytochrome b subunit of formate dehydrogenase
MGIFMVPGGLHAMMSGRVSRRFARSHHPLWYAKIADDPPARR